MALLKTNRHILIYHSVSEVNRKSFYRFLSYHFFFCCLVSSSFHFVTTLSLSLSLNYPCTSTIGRKPIYIFFLVLLCSVFLFCFPIFFIHPTTIHSAACLLIAFFPDSLVTICFGLHSCPHTRTEHLSTSSDTAFLYISHSEVHMQILNNIHPHFFNTNILTLSLHVGIKKKCIFFCNENLKESTPHSKSFQKLPYVFF